MANRISIDRARELFLALSLIDSRICCGVDNQFRGLNRKPRGQHSCIGEIDIIDVDSV